MTMPRVTRMEALIAKRTRHGGKFGTEGLHPHLVRWFNGAHAKIRVRGTESGLEVEGRLAVTDGVRPRFVLQVGGMQVRLGPDTQVMAYIRGHDATWTSALGR